MVKPIRSPKHLKRIKRILKKDVHKMRILGRKRILVKRLLGKKAEVWGYKTFLKNYDHFHWLFMPLEKEKIGPENFFTMTRRNRMAEKGYSFENLEEDRGELVERTINAMGRFYKGPIWKTKKFEKNVGPLLYDLYLFLRTKGFSNHELT